jgi:DNA-damage-inducible protein D
LTDPSNEVYTSAERYKAERRDVVADAPTLSEGQLAIAEFKGKEVRRVIHDDEWYFSVVDVIEAVTESGRPGPYWTDLKRRLRAEGAEQVYANIVQLKMPGAGGKNYGTDAADTETIFRIVQSVPSKRAEPFKRWLAKIGYERILEFQNPEIAIKRAILDYRNKGYADEWINARVRSILTRNELTTEWKRRGVDDGKEFAALTNAIQQATFGLGAGSHKMLKHLKKRHNLRDHMTDVELIFTMLGERSTRDIAVSDNAQGFTANKDAADAGGKVAGDARLALEKRTGRQVVSEHNFLPNTPQPRRLN